MVTFSSSDPVVSGLGIEIELRKKKIEQLQKEVEVLTAAVIVVNQDPELEQLLDEEERIEAQARRGFSFST